QFAAPEDDPNIIGQIDKIRLAAYNLYDGMYHNRQESLKIHVRGEDQNPIYIPSAKKIIEATSRYLMVGFDYFAKGPIDSESEDNSAPDSIVNADTQNSNSAIEAYFDSLFKREKVKS